jgi:hypothetical protein
MNQSHDNGTLIIKWHVLSFYLTKIRFEETSIYLEENVQEENEHMGLLAPAHTCFSTQHLSS